MDIIKDRSVVKGKHFLNCCHIFCPHNCIVEFRYVSFKYRVRLQTQHQDVHNAIMLCNCIHLNLYPAIVLTKVKLCWLISPKIQLTCFPCFRPPRDACAIVHCLAIQAVCFACTVHPRIRFGFAQTRVSQRSYLHSTAEGFVRIPHLPQIMETSFCQQQPLVLNIIIIFSFRPSVNAPSSKEIQG